MLTSRISRSASFADRQTMHSLRIQQNITALQKAADCEVSYRTLEWRTEVANVHPSDYFTPFW
jgi:hypothetical protein